MSPVPARRGKADRPYSLLSLATMPEPGSPGPDGTGDILCDVLSQWEDVQPRETSGESLDMIMAAWYPSQQSPKQEVLVRNRPVDGHSRFRVQGRG